MEKTHFEYMEEVGQVNIFELLQEEKSPLNIGDKVKCNITEESDWEGHNYLKYYAPFALTDVGEVVNISGDVAIIRYKTTEVMFNIKELDY